MIIAVASYDKNQTTIKTNGLKVQLRYGLSLKTSNRKKENEHLEAESRLEEDNLKLIKVVNKNTLC